MLLIKNNLNGTQATFFVVFFGEILKSHSFFAYIYFVILKGVLWTSHPKNEVGPPVSP